MGFDNECIVNIQSLPGEYFCPVCRTLAFPNEALQAQCSHLYCKPCLAYVVATTRACPYDGYLVVEADAKPLLESNKSIAEAIGKVAVQCLYQRSGCAWQGTLTECIAHCTDCSYGNSPVVCNRCGTQIIHRLVQDHAQNCPGLQPQLQQLDNSQAQTSGAQNQIATQDLSLAPITAGGSTSALTSVATTAQLAVVPAASVPVPTPVAATQDQPNSQQGVQGMTPEQWYQQQQMQYQQYYQQYSNYDPYQQQYQQYNQYQQQIYQQYPQPYTQVPGQSVVQGQQPESLSQPQPSMQVQAGLQQSQQPQFLQPQPQPQMHPQRPVPQQYQNIHPQTMQPQPSVPSQQSLPPTHPQVQTLPNAPLQQPIPGHHPQALQPLPLPPQGQSQPHPLPHQTLPPPQHQQPLMQQLQQPPAQHPTQIPAQHQQHPPPMQQLQPYLHPRPLPQAQTAPGVTGYQSYPQTYPPQLTPGVPQRPPSQQQTMLHQHPQQHVQVQNQFPPHQPSQMCPPSNQFPMQTPQQPVMLPHQGPRPGVPPVQQQIPHPSPISGQPYQHPAGLQPPTHQIVPLQQVHLQQPFHQGPAMLHQPAHSSQQRPSLQIQQAFFPYQAQSITNKPSLPNQGVPQHPSQQSAQPSYVGKSSSLPAALEQKPSNVFAAAPLGASHSPSDIQGKLVPGRVSEVPELHRDTVNDNTDISDKELRVSLTESVPSVVSDVKTNTMIEDNLPDAGCKVTKDENMAMSEDKQSTEEIASKKGKQLAAPLGDEVISSDESSQNKKSSKQVFENDASGTGRVQTLSDRQETLGSVSQNLIANNLPVSDPSDAPNGLDKGQHIQRHNVYDGSFSQPSGIGPNPSQSSQQSRFPEPLQGLTPSGLYHNPERPPHNVPFGHHPNISDPSMAFHWPLPADRIPQQHIPQHVPMQERFQGLPSQNPPLHMQPLPPGEFMRPEPFEPPQGRGSFGSVRPEFPSPGLPGSGFPTGARAPLGPHAAEANYQHSVPLGRSVMHGPPAGTYETPNGMMSRGPAFFHDQAGQIRPTNFSESDAMIRSGRQIDLPQSFPSGLPPVGHPYSVNTKSGPVHGIGGERSGPLPEESFRPGMIDPRSHIDRQREFEEDLKQFPRPDNLDREVFSRLDGNLSSSRPIERGPQSFYLDAVARPLDRASHQNEGDFDAISKRSVHPYQSIGTFSDNNGGSPRLQMDSRERIRAPFFHDDIGKRPDSIWNGPEPGHRIDSISSLRSPRRDFGRPFLSKFGHSVHSHVEDYLPHGFHDSSKAVDPNLVSFHESRYGRPPGPGSDPYLVHFNRSDSSVPDIIPSQSQGYEGLRRDRRINEPGYHGSFASHSHMRDSVVGDFTPRLQTGEPGFGGYPSHGFSNESDRISSIQRFGDFDGFEFPRKQRFGSAGWCRICKIDYDTVEGLEIHSQTKGHQNVALDLVRAIKEENSRKKKLPLDDIVNAEDISKSKNSSFETRGDRR